MFKRKVNRSVGGTIVLFLFMAIVGVFTSIPLVYVVSNAFKPIDQLYIFPPPIFVTNPTSEHFTELIQLCSEYRVPLSRYVVNSLFISVVAVIGHVLLSSMAAYPLAKHKFPGKGFIRKIVVMSLLFTSAVTAIPQYVVMSKLHLLNTHWSIIFPMFMSSLGLYGSDKRFAYRGGAYRRCGGIQNLLFGNNAELQACMAYAADILFSAGLEQHGQSLYIR